MQLVHRKDYKFGYQIRASIVFYQKTIHRWFLEWLKGYFKVGYVRDRNDGMTEYTIVGVKDVQKTLEILKPYLKLKKKQAELAISICKKMPKIGKRMKVQLLLTLAREVDRFVDLNYSKKRTNTSSVLEAFLKSHKLLDPVETDP